MSEFLDELARTMATAMPRRRALRVLGAAVVTAWAGGATSVARAGQQAHWCHGMVRSNDWKFCTPETEACFPTCCPREWICSKGPCGNSGCCEMACCDPCNPKSARGPDGNGGCKPGPVPDHCHCKPGQKPCNAGIGHGVVCCDQDEYCATSRKEEGSGHSVTGTCCKRGESFCLGVRRERSGSPARAFCCPRGTRCCILAGVCCSRTTQTCEVGGCRCKPGHTVRCGRHCCHPQRQKCCGGPNKRCVPVDRDCVP